MSAKSNGRGEAGGLSVGFYTSLSAVNLQVTLVDFRQRCPQVALGMAKPRDGGGAAIFGVSAPAAIGHARSCGVSCEMVGASIARSTANASFPFAAQSARACSP